MTMSVNAVQHIWKLQTQEHKHKSVQQKLQRVPDSPRLQSHSGGKEGRAATADKQTAYHDGDHAGTLHCVAHEIRRVWHDQRQGNLHWSVVHPVLQPDYEQSDG